MSIGILSPVFLIFITLKLSQFGVVAGWSWGWVFAPLWAQFAIGFALGFVRAIFQRRETSPKPVRSLKNEINKYGAIKSALQAFLPVAAFTPNQFEKIEQLKPHTFENLLYDRGFLITPNDNSESTKKISCTSIPPLSSKACQEVVSSEEVTKQAIFSELLDLQERIKVATVCLETAINANNVGFAVYYRDKRSEYANKHKELLNKAIKLGYLPMGAISYTLPLTLSTDEK